MYQKNISEDTDNTNENKKMYGLKNDVFFQALFARKGNEQFLIDFLTGILKVEIKEIEIEEEVNILKLSNMEKGGRIDLQATLGDGTIVSIEMQMKNNHNIEKRSEFNAAGVIRKKTEKGTKYQNIKQVIMINILDYNLLKVDEYISETVTVLDKHRDYELPNLIKHYFIELPKFRKQKPDMNDKLNQWLALLDNEDGGMIKMAEKKNEKVKSVLDEMRFLTGDAELRRIAELREKWEMDWNSEIDNAREEGLTQGRKQGLKEGREKGIKQGIEEGKKEAKLETAKKLLKSGIAINIIIEATGLTEKEILELK